MLLENKAKMLIKNAKGLTDDQEALIDLATINNAIDLFKEIIALYKSCNRPASMAAENMRGPGIVNRRRLKKLIASRPLPEGVTAKQMQASVLEVGKTMTLEEVTEAYTLA